MIIRKNYSLFYQHRYRVCYAKEMKSKEPIETKVTSALISTEKLLVGWQEWCALPHLKLPAIKAKIDTGAKTSALHAFNIVPFLEHGSYHVKFEIHPIQHNDRVIVHCQAPLVDERIVINSGGHRERRHVIQTLMSISGHEWPIEITLTNRDSMQFRMLLGRDALRDHAIIEPAQMLLHPRYSRWELKTLYAHGKTVKPRVPRAS